MCFFNIIYLESKVVRLVYDKTKIFVIKVLWSNLSATSILFDRDLRFFNNTDSITKVGDFTKVIIIGDVLRNRRLKKNKLCLFGIIYRAKITIR